MLFAGRHSLADLPPVHPEKPDPEKGGFLHIREGRVDPDVGKKRLFFQIPHPTARPALSFARVLGLARFLSFIIFLIILR